MGINLKAIHIRFILLLALISSILIDIILIITPQVESYEPSIYSAFPNYFWLLIVISLIFGSLVVIHSDDKKYLLYGVGVILYINILIISLPIFRGYFIYSRGDIITHIGCIKDLMGRGFVHDQNYYPGLHVFATNFALITKMPVTIIFQFFSIVFYIFFSSSIYILFKHGFNDINRKYPILLGILLIFGAVHLNIKPNNMVFLFLPLLIYLIIKIYREKKKKNTLICFFIMMVGLIFSHPISSFYIFIILIIFDLYIYHSSFLKYSDEHQFRNLPNKGVLALFSLWFNWYFLFPTIQHGFRKALYSLFIEEAINPALVYYTAALNVYDVKVIDAIQIIMFRFGLEMILLFFSLLIILFTLVKQRKSTIFVFFNKNLSGFFILSFLTFVVWSGMNFFVDFVHFYRLFKWFTFFSIFISTIIINFSFQNRLTKTIILTILIFIIIVISVFSVHPSSISKEANNQVSLQEVVGSEWFLENSKGNESIWSFGTDRERMGHLIYGRYSVPDRIQSQQEKEMPQHFGYKEHETVGENFSGYITHTDVTRILFYEVFTDYEEDWFFNETTYNKLNNDSSVNRVYDNEFYYTYKIEKMNS